MAHALKKGNHPLARRIFTQTFAPHFATRKIMLTRELKKDKAREQQEINDALKFATAFNEQLAKKFGDNAVRAANELTAAAKGKKLRNADEALRAFEKYPNKKYSAKDRQAIAHALEATDKMQIAKNLRIFSKVMGLTGKVVDGVELLTAFRTAIYNDNWRPFFVKAETLIAGSAATGLVVFAFSVIATNPLT